MKSGLHELFLDELADMYSAEQQLTKALPKSNLAMASGSLLRNSIGLMTLGIFNDFGRDFRARK